MYVCIFIIYIYIRIFLLSRSGADGQVLIGLGQVKT